MQSCFKVPFSAGHKKGHGLSPSICHEPECDNSISIPMQHRPIRTRAVSRTPRAQEYKSRRLALIQHQSFSDYPDLCISFRARFETTLNSSIMTFEEVAIQKPSERAQGTGKALEELLVSAKSNECLTIGVYESAKVMNV